MVLLHITLIKSYVNQSNHMSMVVIFYGREASRFAKVSKVSVKGSSGNKLPVNHII